MKKTMLPIILVLGFSAAQAQSQPTPSIIPVPASLVKNSGSFILKNNSSISVTDNKEVDALGLTLAKKLHNVTGYNLRVDHILKGKGIKLLLLKTANASLGNEGYQLNVTDSVVTISANKAAGLFYGTQTLLQLFPKEIESKSQVNHVSWTLPCVTIDDQPRFGWRGLMLDVSRHFFTKAEVKQFMDDMVKFKFNLLHLHLTDDEGWRIEIKSLPKLTAVGAWRVERNGRWSNSPNAPDASEPKTYGGFYTQEDIKELVQYAKERYLTILPEIDVPGHSMAALAAYPELSCTGGEHKMYQGQSFMNWFPGGRFEAIVENGLCPANEKVYEFLDKVFTEVAALFPFEYIHMGGDECAKNFWEKSPAVQELMKKEGLKTMPEVESYFVRRVEKIVNSKGKKLMGWDEILEGGISPTANVMSWRGVKGGIEAAASKHNVVMSPTTFTYLDYVQGEPLLEPPVYATLRLNKAYTFDPVQPGMDPKYVLGGQGNQWTEQLGNYRSLQYMTWPRALAVAESVWSPKDKKDWNSFASRVENQFDRWDISDAKYSKAIYDAIVSASKDDKGNLYANLSTELSGMSIYYSFDESNPDNYYPEYTKPVLVPQDAVTMKIVTYRNGKQIGKQINMPVTELSKRVEKK
ncbi:MAG: family 20 glycosylhydrolase [Chitinophagaceae bacterium]|nr:family 20 glycosylhydrolase [Chitinophagaceae bacterium]